jgi:hypothetical protein
MKVYREIIMVSIFVDHRRQSGVWGVWIAAAGSRQLEKTCADSRMSVAGRKAAAAKWTVRLVWLIFLCGPEATSA